MLALINKIKKNEQDYQREVDFLNDVKFSKDYWKKWNHDSERYYNEYSDYGNACRDKWAAFKEEMKVFDVLCADMIKFDEDDVKKRDAKYHANLKKNGSKMGMVRFQGKGRGISFPDHIWRFIKEFAIPDWNVPMQPAHLTFQINTRYEATRNGAALQYFQFRGYTKKGLGRFARNGTTKRVRLRTIGFGANIPNEYNSLRSYSRNNGYFNDDRDSKVDLISFLTNQNNYNWKENLIKDYRGREL